MCADTGIDDLQETKNFKVSAEVVRGCLLGGDIVDTSHFGTVTFSEISSLDLAIDTVSSKGAGSVIIKCTLGITVTVSFDNGVHTSGSIASGRYLLNPVTNETLRYQLYQDIAYSIIWGNGGNGGEQKVVTSTGEVEEHKVYARLFASSVLPTSGAYTDTIMVTVSY